MTKQPLISIILTTFNRSHLILETLSSIQNQTYENWECSIIDDNSNDNTNEVVNEFIKNDTRFSFHVKGNKYVKGLSASRNMGMDLLSNKTEYLQFFDDDDIMHPQKFEIQLNEFKKFSYINLTISPTLNFNKSNELDIIEISKFYQSYIIKNIHEEFFLGNTIFTAQVPLFKYKYFKNERFDEKLFYAEEWELFNKLFFTRKTKVSFVNANLFYHRKHNLSITANLYKDSNIKPISKNKAFISVYNTLKETKQFSDKYFNRIVTFAYYNKFEPSFLNLIQKDLKKGLLSSKFKNIFVYNLLKSDHIKSKIISKIILKLVLRISRF